jgi:hypothetical protein
MAYFSNMLHVNERIKIDLSKYNVHPPPKIVHCLNNNQKTHNDFLILKTFNRLPRINRKRYEYIEHTASQIR